MHATVAVEDFDVVLDKQGRVHMDLGTDPSPEILQHARELAERMATWEGTPLAMADCQPQDQIQARAARLAALFLGGAR